MLNFVESLKAITHFLYLLCIRVDRFMVTFRHFELCIYSLTATCYLTISSPCINIKVFTFREMSSSSKRVNYGFH
uniref:Secreted protein n=1 Tax=Schistosoma mansoni TaxID=6183 RepID=A0A5K4F8I9_SCHMA